MPTVRLCASCNGHGSRNYHLSLPFPVPELGPTKTSSVSAGTIDLCDACWNRLTNKRTLTVEGVLARAEKRHAAVLERARELGNL
jgi:hypothetical protein